MYLPYLNQVLAGITSGMVGFNRPDIGLLSTIPELFSTIAELGAPELTNATVIRLLKANRDVTKHYVRDRKHTSEYSGMWIIS